MGTTFIFSTINAAALKRGADSGVINDKKVVLKNSYACPCIL